MKVVMFSFFENYIPWLGSSGTKEMSRSTTPGSIGRKTLSHSERGASSALAGRGERLTPSNGGRAMAAAVSAINCLRLMLAALHRGNRGGKLWGRRGRGVVVVGLRGVKMEFEKSARDDDAILFVGGNTSLTLVILSQWKSCLRGTVRWEYLIKYSSGHKFVIEGPSDPPCLQQHSHALQ